MGQPLSSDDLELIETSLNKIPKDTLFGMCNAVILTFMGIGIFIFLM